MHFQSKNMAKYKGLFSTKKCLMLCFLKSFLTKIHCVNAICTFGAVPLCFFAVLIKLFLGKRKITLCREKPPCMVVLSSFAVSQNVHRGRTIFKSKPTFQAFKDLFSTRDKLSTFISGKYSTKRDFYKYSKLQIQKVNKE